MTEEIKTEKKGKKTEALVGGGKDDNLMAALAHGLGIITSVLVPLIIWLTQKDKSRYVGFQAKQAVVYQFLVIVIMICLWVPTMVLTMVYIGVCCIPLVFIVWVGSIVYALYAAYMTYKGEDFKYAIIGDMLK